MSKKEEKERCKAEEKETVKQQETEKTQSGQETDASEEATETGKESTPEDKIEELEKELEKQKKEYLFLMAEFDNYRKRTLREKQELLKDGAKDAMLNLLPIVDDLDRAFDAMEKGGDCETFKTGMGLIYNKLIKYLDSNKVKAFESTGKDFDTDFQEAVSLFPTDDDTQKGKVIDTVLKGYMINDKVLRHAKVVVGK